MTRSGPIRLREAVPVRQPAGDPPRRWFSSEELDLIVWLDAGGAPAAFELCFDRCSAERAVRWQPETGLLIAAIDDGERDAGLRHKATPIAVPDGQGALARGAALFQRAAGSLPPEIERFVREKLLLRTTPAEPAPP